MKHSSIKLPDIPELYVVKETDVDKVTKMLERAFADDPLWKVILKGQEEEKKVVYVFEFLIRYGLKYGRVYADSSAINGAGVWLATPNTNMNIWQLLRSGVIKLGVKLGIKTGMKMDQIFSIIKEDRKKRMENQPYVYLSLLGVEPAKQGQGIGTKLVKKMIEHLPNDIPIYLETETEQNVHYYEKFDFEVVKKVYLPKVDLPMWEMVKWKRTE